MFLTYKVKRNKNKNNDTIYLNYQIYAYKEIHIGSCIANLICK